MTVTREDYEHACETIARMHAAAVGEITGPRRGVVEDVEDLRIERDQLRADRDALVEEGESIRAAYEELKGDFEKLQAKPQLAYSGNADQQDWHARYVAAVNLLALSGYGQDVCMCPDHQQCRRLLKEAAELGVLVQR